MRRLLLACLVLVLLLTAGNAAAEPTPDPPPGGHWNGTYYSYTYWTTDIRRFYNVLCYVPADGSKRKCWRISMTRNGVRAAMR